MTETRTTSRTGGQKGVKPQRHSLVPKEGIDVIAEVFAFGATKYADHNWRRGYEWSKSYDAMLRHLTAWWSGEDVDPESGLSHLGHAGFHMMALATWERLGGRYEEFDDRYVEPVEEEERRLLAEQADLDGVTVGDDVGVEWREPALTSHQARGDAMQEAVARLVTPYVARQEESISRVQEAIARMQESVARVASPNDDYSWAESEELLRAHYRTLAEEEGGEEEGEEVVEHPPLLYLGGRLAALRLTAFQSAVNDRLNRH